MKIESEHSAYARARYACGELRRGQDLTQIGDKIFHRFISFHQLLMRRLMPECFGRRDSRGITRWN
jgi:hypothetical protein